MLSVLTRADRRMSFPATLSDDNSNPDPLVLPAFPFHDPAPTALYHG